MLKCGRVCAADKQTQQQQKQQQQAEQSVLFPVSASLHFCFNLFSTLHLFARLSSENHHDDTDGEENDKEP